MQPDPRGSPGKLAKRPGGLGQWGRHCKVQSSLGHLSSPLLLRSLVSWGVGRGSFPNRSLQEFLLAFWVPTIMRQMMNYYCQMA